MYDRPATKIALDLEWPHDLTFPTAFFFDFFVVFVKVFPRDLKFSDLALTTCKLCRENKYDTNRAKTEE